MGTVLAVHQPNYLPWMGYFHKIAHCDVFVFLDNVQYEEGGFTNRNRIKTSQGPRWLTIPVFSKGNRYQLVKDVRVADPALAGMQHWRALQTAYARAPCYGEYAPRFRAMYERPWVYLADLNKALIIDICGMLGISGVEFKSASAMPVSGAKSELLAQICREIGADTFLTGSGGSRTYLQEEPFRQVGTRLAFDDFAHPTHRQLWGEFCPNMSVVDLLFNEGRGSLDIMEANCRTRRDR